MNPHHILILAKVSEIIKSLANGLTRKGYICEVVSDEGDLANRESTEILLIETENEQNDPELRDLITRIKQDRRIIIILLVEKETLRFMDVGFSVDDFVLKPYDIDELTVRIKRLLQRSQPIKESEDYLISGDLIIDLPRCEVLVAGRIVDLTFTEYELLKLLVSRKGHVLTREALLNQIWGYDYFGGDRTVDVHITRLRSKIEDSTHSFIETVRNIGYRIKTDAK